MKLARFTARNGDLVLVNPAAVAFVVAEAIGGARIHASGGAISPILGEDAETVAARIEETPGLEIAEAPGPAPAGADPGADPGAALPLEPAKKGGGK